MTSPRAQDPGPRRRTRWRALAVTVVALAVTAAIVLVTRRLVPPTPAEVDSSTAAGPVRNLPARPAPPPRDDGPAEGEGRVPVPRSEGWPGGHPGRLAEREARSSLVVELVDPWGEPVPGATVLGAPAGPYLRWPEPAVARTAPRRDRAPVPTMAERYAATGGLPPWPLDAPSLPEGVLEAHVLGGGAHVFPRFPAGPAVLSVRADGYASLDTDTVDVPHDAAPRHVVRLVLQPAVELTGVVRDADGRPVEDAWISRPAPRAGPLASATSTGEPLARTDREGRFELRRLAPGPWEVDVAHAAFATRRFSGVRNEAGPVEEELDWTLERGSTISGVVRGAAAHGGPLRVVAVPAAAGVELQRGAPAHTLSGARATWAGAGDLAADEFVLGGLELRTPYLVRAYPPDRRFADVDAWSRPVVARGGAEDVELEYRPDASLQFRVALDPGEGRSLRAARDGIEVRLDGVCAADPRRTLEPLSGCEKGRGYRLDGLRPTRGDARVGLSVVAPGHTELYLSDIEVYPGIHGELGTLPLDRNPALEVQLRSTWSEAPVAGAELYLEPLVDPGGLVPCRATTTDRDGRASLDRFPSVPSRLAVLANGHAPAFELAPVVPQAPATRHTIALEASGSLRVRAVDEWGDPLAGVPLEREPPERRTLACLGGDGRARVAITDADGYADFRGLAAGVESVRAHGPAYRPVELAPFPAVAPGELSEGELVLGSLGRLFGELYHNGYPIAGARMRWRAADDWAPFVSSDADGRFAFRRLWCSDATLVVEHPNLAVPVPLEEVVEGGEIPHVLDLSTGVVIGAIEAPRPTLAAGVEVRVVLTPELEEGEARDSRLLVPSSAWPENVLALMDRDPPPPAGHTDLAGRFELAGVPRSTPFVLQFRRHLQIAHETEAMVLRGRSLVVPEPIEVGPSGFLRMRGNADHGESGDVDGFLALRLEGEPPFEMHYLPFDEWTGLGLGTLLPGSWRVEACTVGPLGELLEHWTVDREQLDPGEITRF